MPDQKQHPELRLITKAYIANTRKIFFIHAAIGLPLFWLGSTTLVCIWIVTSQVGYKPQAKLIELFGLTALFISLFQLIAAGFAYYSDCYKKQDRSNIYGVVERYVIIEYLTIISTLIMVMSFIQGIKQAS